MKQKLLLFAFIFNIATAFAQIPGGGAPSITGKISGTIIDSITKNPVDYATIAVSRSGSAKSTNGSLTDEKGSFKVVNIVPGSYRVTIAFLGYQTKVIDPVKTTPEKPDINLGKIILSPNQKTLNEVVVTGQAAVIENKVDKIVYNAERDVTVSGGNATDVLRKVPLLSVDIDGNVALRGSQNVKVLINGKPSGSMASNMADALKMIPADQIKNVEVITSPSAKYDAEGTSGIINIITKKKNVEGVSGSISGGVGTRQNNGNANVNIKKGRLGLTGNIGGNGSWPQTSNISFSQFNPANQPISNQKSSSRTSRLGFRGSVGVDYDINSYNSINSTLSFNRFGNTVAGDVFTNRFFNNVASTVNSTTSREFKVPGIDWSTDYTKKFKKEGEELSFAAQLSYGKTFQDYTTVYTSGPNPNEIGDNNAKNQEITLQADYIYPFKKITLEAGAKTIIRDITSDTRVDTAENDVYSLNTFRSNLFDYSQNVVAGYSTLGFTLAKKYNFKVGGRTEYTKISGSSTSANPFDNDYFTIVPSATISRTFKNSQTLKISYNKRISRPSMFFLNPFRNASDPLNQSEGNPKLSPEVSNNIEFGYSTFVKTTVINASIFYRHTNNLIESFVTKGKDLQTDSTVNIQTFRNIGSNNSLGMSLFGSVNPIPKLTLRGNLNLSTYDVNVLSANALGVIGTGKTFLLYNAFLSGSMTFKYGIIAETFAILNSPRRTSQGESASFNMWNIGFKKQILKKKGSIGLNIIDPFNERKNFRSNLTTPDYTQASNFSVPFRSVGVNFSWQFGKMNFNPQQQRKKRGVSNDDLKQGEQTGGGN
ncbi:MAG: TonB-dependent receptor plug [Sphingobacteriales bacterium]|nr:TonB-dependent receptor plug [Sphingobacteriales bacterium]